MTGQRRFLADRCAGCGLHPHLCLCASMPQLELRTRIIVVQNDHERGKPTNTGRLARLMITNSELLRYGVRGEIFDPSPLQHDDCDYRLVFHRGQPQEVVSARTFAELVGRARALVFLDGTWSQCSRMSHRVPGLAEMPPLALPPGPPSPWRVRAETHPERMSTLEAVVRAVEIVEGPEPARTMREWFYRVTARLMYMKGLLRGPEMPPEWGQPSRSAAGFESGGE